MSGEVKETAAGGGAPFSGRSGIVICILVIVMCFDLFNFGAFWFGRALSQGGLTEMSRNIRSGVWPGFVREVEYYRQLNMAPTNFVLRKYLSLRRKIEGNIGPMIDFFCLKVLRLTGLLSYLGGGILVVAFAGAEALKKNKEKRLNFGRVSSTAYHFSLNTGLVFTGCFISLYVFLPGRLVIPGITAISLPVTAINLPLTAAAVITLSAGFIVYVMVSNASSKI